MACFPVDGECMTRNEVAFGHLGRGVFSGLRLCLGAGAHRCSSVLGQLATVALLLALPLEALAGATRFSVAETSDLPVHALEDPSAGANVVAVGGGNGLNNAKGKSRNYLVREKQTFADAGLNVYLFPNASSDEKANYRLRDSAERVVRLRALVAAIRARNDKLIYLVGFSRGSVDAARFAKTHPDEIAGIALVSGIYTNPSPKAGDYTMEAIIGTEIATPALVVHHVADTCRVTRFHYAEAFFRALRAPLKALLSYTGGTATGRDCGPRNHHGFEGIEAAVAEDIAGWILTRARQ